MVGGPKLESRRAGGRATTLRLRGGGRGACHLSGPEATAAVFAAYLGPESLLCFASLEKSRLC